MLKKGTKMERLTTKSKVFGDITFKDNGCTLDEVKHRLYEYEEAEEQGLLIRLPCKVGDSVLKVTDRITEYVITAFWIYEGKMVVCSENYQTGIGFTFDANCIGKRYFLTKEEAEKELEKMGD